ncbi:MAG: GNAT family N-acetyltransferase [Terriglobia bacterium]
MVADPLPPDLMGVTLRPARLMDAAAFASLATQLGYPSSPRQVEERMTTVLDDPKHLILAAVLGTSVVGWVHAYVCNLLESDAYAEIGGLVVDESYRGQGVGWKLMEGVEDWARQKGCHAVSVRSSVIRHEAHKFYAGRGFELIKTQHAFRKRL